jgi:AcrR family transcriptional regulator
MSTKREPDDIDQNPASAVRPRLGGRSARVRRGVLEATLALLREQGDGFSIPQVAARAGVHDATIYRRWGTRDALIVDAIRSHLGETVPLPDTGSLTGDLTAFLERSVAFLASPLGTQLVRATVGAESPAADNPRATYWPVRLEEIGVMVERAVARGELPRARLAEATLTAEMLLAPLYFRLLVTRGPLDETFASQVAAFVERALRSGSERTSALDGGSTPVRAALTFDDERRGP